MPEIAKILKNEKLTERVMATTDAMGARPRSPFPMPRWKSHGPDPEDLPEGAHGDPPEVRPGGARLCAPSSWLNAAIGFKSGKMQFTPEEFETEAGVGATVTDVEIAEVVTANITSLSAEISNPMRSR